MALYSCQELWAKYMSSFSGRCLMITEHEGLGADLRSFFRGPYIYDVRLRVVPKWIM